ncbi:MAG: diguanylate cyclase [Clostridiales bacterium]|nr:diguanylate cyclase [Clostridiales bacterium]
MKKFEILRYLKKFSALVLILALVGSGLIYMYSVRKQQYTASAVIRYTNDGIKNGYTPDGTALDVNEIYSSAVVTSAMESLKINGTPDIIRSNCKVESVVSKEQESLNQALIEKGEDPEFFPDAYRVTLVVDGKKGARYAQKVLDAIIQSYCSFYTEKYVEHRLSLDSSTDLLERGYDYFECVYILDHDTRDMLSFVRDKKEKFPHFRSSVTGSSYADLYDIYNEYYKYVVPQLYKSVINGPQAKDVILTRQTLSDKIKQSERDEKVNVGQRSYLKKLIDNFADKNKEIQRSNFGDEEKSEDENSSGYIIKDVEGTKEYGNKQTTYDELILKYVQIDKTIKADEVDRNHLKYFLTVFEKTDAGSSGSEQAHVALEKQINEYEKTLTEDYKIVNETSKELNRALSADYLKLESSVRVKEAVNVKKYVVLALLFFIIVGVIGAIVLGRAGDIINYYLYVDKKTGLSNRQSCDLYIEKQSKTLLLDNITCMAFNFTGLAKLTQKYGYSVGNNVLHDFAMLLDAMDEHGRNVFYNDAGRFLAFFEQCNSKKAEVILGILRDQVDSYNKLNPDYEITYEAAYSTTTDEGIYEVRQLIKCTMGKLRKNDTKGAPDAKSGDKPKENASEKIEEKSENDNGAESGKETETKPKDEKSNDDEEFTVPEGTFDIEDVSGKNNTE